MPQFPTSNAEPWTFSPGTIDPKTPPVDIGPWMQPVLRHRSPILILVTIAVVCVVIISGVIAFFLSNPGKSTAHMKLATLVVTPSTLDFGELEQSVKLTLPIIINNTGGQRLSWSVTDDATTTNWLAIGTRSATIEPKASQQNDMVTVDTSHMPRGLSFAYLTINSNGGKALVTVKVNVLPSGSPKLNVIPTSLDFGTYPEAMPVPGQSIMVINGGTRELQWKVNAANAPWLTLDKNSSRNWMLPSGGKQMINMTVNKGLIQGSYSATVTITSNGGKKDVSVSLVVISPPPPQARLTLSSLSLNFGQVVANTTLTKQVIVNNTGLQTLNWTAITQTASGGSWLSIDKTGSTINQGAPAQTINVTANTSDLSPGPYSATLNFTSNGGNAQAQITLMVNAPPAVIGVSPNSLDFGTVTSGQTATLQEIVDNSGGQSLNWSLDITSLPTWLSVDSSSGTVQPGSSQTVNLTANTSSVSTGSYSATLNFTSNGGNAQVTVTIIVQ